MRIDADDNIWTTDDTNNTVLKLSPAGKVLLVLGRRNKGGEANRLFSKPTDVAFSKNGDIFVTDGYGNSRVVKFDHYGNFIKTWGSYGSGPGEFVLPHSVVIDKNDRVGPVSYLPPHVSAFVTLACTGGAACDQVG